MQKQRQQQQQQKQQGSIRKRINDGALWGRGEGAQSKKEARRGSLTHPLTLVAVVGVTMGGG